MDDAIYVALTRQRGLAQEAATIANNIANISTTGYRREGLVFSEYIAKEGAGPSISMGDLGARYYDAGYGVVQTTGGPLDLAIEGRGFFLVETPSGERLTRAGAFMPSPESELVTPDGHRVLDEGGAPIFLPPEARAITVGSDGTVSADGQFVARIAVVDAEQVGLRREGSIFFVPTEGFDPVEGARVRQGALEASNVNPIVEIARLIEVQRAYERSHSLLEGEDERISAAVRTLGRDV